MSAYLYSVLLVVLLAGVICTVISSKNDSMLAFCVSLAVTVTVASPLASMGDGDVTEFLVSIFEDSEVDGYTPPTDNARAAVEQGIRSEICREFSLSEENVGAVVKINITDGGIIIEHIEINLTGSAVGADIPKIIHYIENGCGCECEVLINGK